MGKGSRPTMESREQSTVQRNVVALSAISRKRTISAIRVRIDDFVARRIATGDTERVGRPYALFG